jgi:cytochrome b6-f complex iron-sulfur subunit
MGSHDDEDNLIPPDDAKGQSAETVEQYLRLHDHIERLREDKSPRKPGKVTPEDARTYQAAALFRAATPGAAEPDPAFIAALRAKLEHEIGAPSPARALRAARGDISRRGLLAGGLGAAAAAAVGVAVGSTLTHETSKPQGSWQTTLISDGAGTWLAVAQVEEIPLGGVKRFATDAVVGFVRHTSSGFEALSGACTHMGCLLSWNAGARTFDCPCHGGRFDENGKAAPGSPVAYSPLPWIKTKVEAGAVWVYIVKAPTEDTTATPGNNPDGYRNP